jgi:hypothetical protein
MLFCTGFLKNYENFSISFKSANRHLFFRAKQKWDVMMFDLATLTLVLGLFALPFIFLGYVHSRVRYELKAIAEVN